MGLLPSLVCGLSRSGCPVGLAGDDEIARQPLLIGPAEVFRDDAV